MCVGESAVRMFRNGARSEENVLDQGVRSVEECVAKVEEER
jgi:lipoate-protein ligase A